MRNFGLKFLILTFLPLPLSGCSKFLDKFARDQTGSTEVRFSSPGGHSAIAVLNGKLLVYIIHEQVGKLRKTVHFNSEEVANSEGAKVSIPNGGYRFYFVGFSGSGMTTDVRCGRANQGQVVHLIGGSVGVEVAMTKAACALPEFSSDSSQINASTGFEPMRFVTCQSAVSLGGFTDASQCLTGNRGDINHTNSLKVELLGFSTLQEYPSEAQANLPGIGSICVAGTGKPGFGNAFTNADTQANTVLKLSDSVILAGLNSNGIHRSSDGGVNFADTAGEPGQILDLDGSGSVVVAGTGSGLYYSTDEGLNWSVSNQGSGIFNDVHASSSSLFFAVKSNGVAYKSTDGGQNWTALGATGITTAGESIWANSTGSEILVGGTESINAELVRSSDSGSSFGSIFSENEGGVWVVKRLGAYLYWGTNAGLYRTEDPVDGLPRTDYCSTGCTNTGRLPSNTVQDLLLHQNTLYVATDNGVGVSIGHDPDTGTSWDNYTTAPLNGNVQALAFANGKLWAAMLGVANPLKVSDSRGSGVPFPATSTLLLPTGGNPVLPLASRVTVYNDPACQSSRRSYYFPIGAAHSEVLPVDKGAMRSGASSYNHLFLKDY